MTKEAYEQMKMVAENGVTARHRKNAKAFALLIQRALDNDDLPQHADKEFVHSSFRYDLGTTLLISESGKVHLSKVEGQILSEFMRNIGRTIPMDKLMGSVDIWRNDPVDTHISSARVRMLNLRNKMKKIGLITPEFPNGFILGIYSYGHVLIDPTKPAQVDKYKKFALQREPKF